MYFMHVDHFSAFPGT